jgi:hypothetical protein
VSRLDFAPKLKEIQLTDIKKGLGVFTPKPEKPVSFAALKATLKKAGYVLDTADITVTGTLLREGQGWFIVIDPSGQRFIHRGLGRETGTVAPGSRSTEFYLAPGLQYAAAPQFVVEGSIQLPVILNTGPEMLRSRSNILLGIRYLF